MRRVLALAPLLLVSACATQPCNPSADRNIFQVGGCVMGGGYQQRQDALRAQLNQAMASQAEADRALIAYPADVPQAGQVPLEAHSRQGRQLVRLAVARPEDALDGEGHGVGPNRLRANVRPVNRHRLQAVSSAPQHQVSAVGVAVAEHLGH